MTALPEGSGALLDGAFDVHVHGQPDLSAVMRSRGDDFGFTVYGSITLNPAMGGVSAAVVELADIGQRLLVTHPLHYTRDPGALRCFADVGAFIEFAGAPLLHPDSRLTIRDVHEAMSALGPDRIILSTDAFSRWAPPEPECLRMFTEQLAYLGWQTAQIRQMTADNPRAFLGTAPQAARS